MSDEKRRIWLLSSGSYSDYTIHCAFSSEEKAELYLYTYHPDDAVYRIEEVTLDPHEREMREGIFGFYVAMRADDGALEHEPTPTLPSDQPGMKATWSVAIRKDSNGWDRPDFERKYAAVVGWINAKDAESAIKVANEQRLALIAAGALDSFVNGESWNPPA